MLGLAFIRRRRFVTEILWRVLATPASHGLAGGVAFIYLMAFLLAIGDLTIDGIPRSMSMFLVGNWESLLLRQRAPFQFEAIAVLEASWLVWLLSPMNIAIGTTLGLLTGLQIALVRIARRCSAACGLSPATGVLAGLPGLLAGSACCAPILFVLLGVQVTTAMITIVGLLIPAALVLLLIGFLVTLSVAAKRCRQADASPSAG